MAIRICVAGATGYLGQHVVAELVNREYDVHALARSTAKAAHLEELGAHPHLVEVTQPETLQGVLDGVEIVVSSLGITRQRDGLRFEDVDFQANLNLLREAERAGVRRFVYVSVFRGQELRHTALVGAKERFVDALIESPIEHCVIRPTGFFSDLEEFLQMARRGRAWLIGDGQQELNPIHGADLAAAIADSLETNAEIVDVGGPETLTTQRMAELAFEAVGGSPKLSRVPQWLCNTVETGLPLVTPQSISGPIQMFLAASRLPMVAPAYGERRLGEFFAEHAAAG
ncbi:MAG: hypothetical protein ACJAYU_000929 [Bradymonadia bacterium]|jgi:uncharacterized protein YbjT (DUF2867 family)